ncbi:MAG: mannose-6-phosphate isomerase-like protein (cupin superfamily) [Alphaproteobacteria bacterium]
MPLRVGVQTSPPGYDTGTHAHPYFEIVTVLSGTGEAWIDGEVDAAPIGPGTTMVFPPNVKHWFRSTGDIDLVTYGVHASPERIVRR